MADDDNRTGGRRISKIEGLVREYDLPVLGARLERAWTGEGGERTSLRDLADQVNRLILERAVAETDLALVDGEVANYYRLLTSDDVSSGDRVEAVTLLKQAGIDVSRLNKYFGHCL
jgi:hypothetical protein